MAPYPTQFPHVNTALRAFLESEGTNHTRQREVGFIVNVSNLPLMMTEEEIIHLFQEVGPVTRVQMVQQRETGKSTGRAIVEFHFLEDATFALEVFHGSFVRGCILELTLGDHEGLNDIGDQFELGESVSPTSIGNGVSPPKFMWPFGPHWPEAWPGILHPTKLDVRAMVIIRSGGDTRTNSKYPRYRRIQEHWFRPKLNPSTHWQRLLKVIVDVVWVIYKAREASSI